MVPRTKDGNQIGQGRLWYRDTSSSKFRGAGEWECVREKIVGNKGKFAIVVQMI